MSIPLVQNNEKDSINTSIIAIKRNIERINMLLGLSNSEEIDTSEFVKKSDIVDVVEAGNMNPVTSNAVVPVDEVTSGNMHSVTSNAVAEMFREYSPKFKTSSISGTTTQSGYLPTSISLNSKFIVSATSVDNLGYAVIPTRVDNCWWFYVCGTITLGQVNPRANATIKIDYYYYDL